MSSRFRHLIEISVAYTLTLISCNVAILLTKQSIISIFRDCYTSRDCAKCPKQNLISVASKTPLKTRLGTCNYWASHLYQPDDYINSHKAAPSPAFYNKIAAMDFINQIKYTRGINYEFNEV